MNYSILCSFSLIFWGFGIQAIIASSSSSSSSSDSSSTSSSSNSDKLGYFVSNTNELIREQIWDNAHDLMKSKLYDELMEYMALNRDATDITFSSRELNKNKIVTEKILNLDEAMFNRLGFILKDEDDVMDLKKAKFKIFKHFLGQLKYNYTKYNFIINGIVANVPKQWYFQYVLSKDSEFRNEFFDDIFTKAYIFESAEETKRIYETMQEIINQIQASSDDNIRFYSLLNLIRFGENVDFEYFKKEIYDMKIDNRQLMEVFNAAALAKHYEIVSFIYNWKKRI